MFIPPAVRPTRIHALSLAACLMVGACAEPLITGELEEEDEPKAPPIHALVTEYAQAHEIDPALAHAIVKVESSYNCRARNGPTVGIMQVNVRTARGVGVNGDLTDCRTGLEAGMRYLRKALDLYGTGCGGISAYNTGIYKTGYCTSYGRKVQRLIVR
jgi:soluble lytic murein transglycosylase-like protein